MTAPAGDAKFVEARVRLRSPAEGGRRFPIHSRYKPNWWVPDPRTEGGRNLVSGAIEIVGADQLPPGGEGIVRIYPFAPELWRHVKVGTPIEMTEGPSFVIAAATVTGVCL